MRGHVLSRKNFFLDVLLDIHIFVGQCPSVKHVQPALKVVQGVSWDLFVCVENLSPLPNGFGQVARERV